MPLFHKYSKDELVLQVAVELKPMFQFIQTYKALNAMVQIWTNSMEQLSEKSKEMADALTVMYGGVMELSNSLKNLQKKEMQKKWWRRFQ